MSIKIQANQVVGVKPMGVAFTANVLFGDYTSFLWDFGDGQTSTLMNPEHTYTTAGYHTVVLTATDTESNVETVIERGLIRVGEVSFQATPSTPSEIPVSVSFTNTSFAPTGYEFTDWSWDFGDVTIGSGATGPSHIYGEYGRYNVFLSARMIKI